MNKMTLFAASALTAIFFASICQAQMVEWQRYDAEAEIPEAAIHVHLDKGSLLCKGAHADAPDGKNAWRDIGTVNNGVCRTQRINEDLQKQENFYLLVAELKSGEAVDLFGDIIIDAEALSGVVEEWTTAWGETAQTANDQYGAYAETYEFPDTEEIAEGDIALVEGKEYPVDPQTLSAIYHMAAGVDLHFGSIRSQVGFMSAFLSENLFADEYAAINQQLIDELAELGTRLAAAEANWVDILQKLDSKIEGVVLGDQGGNAVVSSLGQAQRAAINSISRSEMETGGWNLSKQQAPAGRVQKQSKKKHNNKVAEQENYEGNYSVVAWGTAFIDREVPLLNSSLMQFRETVTQAQTVGNEY